MAKGPYLKKRLDVDDINKIKGLYDHGISITDIAKLYGISRASVRNILRRHKPAVYTSSSTISFKEPQGEGQLMPREEGEGGGVDRVQFVLLQRDIEELKQAIKNITETLKELEQGYRKITLKPISIKEDEERLIAECPNCGASASYQIPKVAPKKFDDVLDMLRQPHEGGRNFLNCPNCRPKVDNLLREFGYELREARR